MDKPPYQLRIKLTSSRPDAVAEALAQLRSLVSDYDQTSEAAASITIDALKSTALDSIMDDFEDWLTKYRISLECEMTIKRPGIRPETRQRLMRASQSTPMDDMLRDALGESDDD